MAKTLNRMWEIGCEAAYNPSRWVRIKHSASAHRNRKPGAVIKNLTAFGTNFIPIPFVGTLVGEVTNTIIRKQREYRIQSKLKGYKADGNLEKEVKHGIKVLDLEELDRARAKVEKAIEDVKKLVRLSSILVSFSHNTSLRYKPT